MPVLAFLFVLSGKNEKCSGHHQKICVKNPPDFSKVKGTSLVARLFSNNLNHGWGIWVKIKTLFGCSLLD
jgi:hypothetical protein